MALSLIDLRAAALDEYPEFGCAQPRHPWWTDVWLWAAAGTVAVDVGLCLLAWIWFG